MKNLEIDWGSADLLTRDIGAVLELLGPINKEWPGSDPGTTEYEVRCCAHFPDNNPSLIIIHDPSNPARSVRYHCRAGCPYEEIMRGAREKAARFAEEEATAEEALMSVPDPHPAITSNPTAPALVNHKPFLRSVFDSPLQWFAAYCGVPLSVLQSLGIEEDRESMQVRFRWAQIARYKYRIVHKGTQRPKDQPVMGWSDDAGRPPLWPALPDELPEDIAICEGESDGCVLRYWGFCAFALTAGATDKPEQRVFDVLRTRGARRLLIFYDQDTPGRSCRDTLVKLCLASDIIPVSVDISAFIDPLYGWQKDPRDLQQSGIFAGPDEAHAAITAMLDEEAERKHQESFDTLEHRAELAPDVLPWIVPNYIVRGGITLISGLPGVGKTTVMMSLFAAMREGWDWLGVTVERTNVIYLTEEGIISLKAKRALYGDMSHIFCMTVNEYLDQDWPADLLIPRILEAARRVHAGLVVIDPVFSFLPCESESDPAQVKPLFRDYLRHIPRAGLALVVTAHDRKSGGEGISRVSGTVATAGSCDVVLTMETDPITGYRKCSIARSRLADPFTVMATTEGQKFVVKDGPDGRSHDKDILAALADKQWHTKAEIALAMGIAEIKVRHPLERLYRDGILAKQQVKRPRLHDEYRLAEPITFDLKTGIAATKKPI